MGERTLFEPCGLIAWLKAMRGPGESYGVIRRLANVAAA